MTQTIDRLHIGKIAVVSAVLGLLGATVTGCDLTKPNNFISDSSESERDTGRGVAQLAPATPGPVPVVLETRTPT